MTANKRASRPRNHAMLLYQGMLNAVGALLALLMWGRFGGVTLDLICGILIASGVATLIWVPRLRAPLSDSAATLLFALNLVPVYAALWISEAVLASRGTLWVPFQPHGLSSLTIAILTPPIRRVGVPTILLPAILAALQFETFSGDQQALLPPNSLYEPWVSAIFAEVLYFYKLHTFRIADFAAARETEAQLMRKTTRTILAIKDLANSPIQSLTVDAEILKELHPEDSPVARRIGKSAFQLRQLNRILDEYLRGNGGIVVEPSIDPREELSKERSAP